MDRISSRKSSGAKSTRLSGEEDAPDIDVHLRRKVVVHHHVRELIVDVDGGIVDDDVDSPVSKRRRLDSRSDFLSTLLRC